jgi:RNA polymerase sigma-70 factor, ECF subfamily
VLPVDFSPAAELGAELAAPLTESVWVEPYPTGPEASYEQRESLELAFIAAVQRLPPGQRAVLLLREVLGFSAAEVAVSLETSVAAVNSSLQRARRALSERLPQRSQQATLRALGDERVRAVVRDYMAAWQRGDIDAVVAMLTEDAILAMPPAPTWFRGHAAIADFYRRYPGQTSWRHVPTWANGQPAVGCYALIEGAFVPMVIDVLTLRGSRICELTAFLAPQPFERFGLPPSP